jgi:hypothetical protein
MSASVEDKYQALREATTRSVLESKGESKAELRQAVFQNRAPEELKALVQKVRTEAYRVTDEDIQKLMAAYSEDALWEVLVAAVLGAADDRLRAALAALEGA